MLCDLQAWILRCQAQLLGQREVFLILLQP